MPKRSATIRRLLLGSAIAIIALLFAFQIVIMVLVGTAQQQAIIVERVQKLGGDAYYDWQLAGTMGPTTKEDFAREIVSEPALFADVSAIDLRGTEADDEDLRVLRKLPRLEVLYVSDTNISDSAIDEFQHAFPDCILHR